MREPGHFCDEQHAGSQNAEEKQERPEEKESIENIARVQLARTRNEIGKGFDHRSSFFLMVVYGEQSGDSFLRIEFIKFYQRPVTLETHVSPEKVLFAMITEDFAAAVAAVGPIFKIPVHNKKEYPHEQSYNGHSHRWDS